MYLNSLEKGLRSGSGPFGGVSERDRAGTRTERRAAQRLGGWGRGRVLVDGRCDCASVLCRW